MRAKAKKKSPHLCINMQKFSITYPPPETVGNNLSWSSLSIISIMLRNLWLHFTIYCTLSKSTKRVAVSELRSSILCKQRECPCNVFCHISFSDHHRPRTFFLLGFLATEFHRVDKTTTTNGPHNFHFFFLQRHHLPPQHTLSTMNALTRTAMQVLPR